MTAYTVRLNRLLYCSCLLLCLSSCNVSRYLKDDELLLKSNDIKFLGKDKIEGKRTLQYELSTLYKQKPNTRFFGFPREWFWLATSDPGDTTAIDRFQRRVIAEQPTIYDEKLTKNTADAMRYFMQYKGYYQADVFAEDLVKGKKTYVTYYITPHKRYAVDSVSYSSRDSAIHRLLQIAKKQTILKKGVGMDLKLYEQEKDRITRFLRNNGYAYFYSNFFNEPLEIDTFQRPNSANLYLEVDPPFNADAHRAYRVGDVIIYPNYNPLQISGELRDSVINGYTFRIRNNDFHVKPQLLLDAVLLKKGQVFSQDLFDKTNKQLTALGTYKFVRIRQEVDSTKLDELLFFIELTPNAKMEIGADFEVNYTNRSGSSGVGNLIGFTLNPSLRNRNLFRGAELLVTNLSAGVEINPRFTDDRFWNTVDLRIQTDLYFPKFRDYLGFWKGLREVPLGKKRRLLSGDFYQALRENAATRITTSYNYILVLDWYQYNLFNGAYGYDFQRSPTKRYIINHVGVDFLKPITAPDFDTLLTLNPFLKNSFGQQFFVSLLFRDLNFVYNSRPTRYGESYYAGAFIELSGAEIWGINALYNEFALQPTTFRLGKSQFSQYAKIEGDVRFYRQYNPKNSIALRLNAGITRPFGFTSDVPYVKQFYVGGPNSIRAWAPRGLGPGGYEDPLSRDQRNNIRLYQTGDLKLEFNAEYRFDIFWRIKGALFVDGGNIWTLRRDTSRIGSQFLLKTRTYTDCDDPYCKNDPFYKQIAVGGGFGVRIDFTYFIFRTDLGIKLRNSFPRINGGAVSEADYWTDFSKWQPKDMTLNLGFGYPF